KRNAGCARERAGTHAKEERPMTPASTTSQTESVPTANPKSPISPPEIDNPQPGDSVPIGNPCPVCGTLRDSWVYNPFLKSSQIHHGWVRHHALLCQCP